MAGSARSEEAPLITVRRSGDVHIVELAGEIAIGRSSFAQPLDLHGHQLEDGAETLKSLLVSNNVRIVLDLRRTTFMDSSGIGQLVAWKKRTLERDGDIKLLVADGPVRRILSVLNLEGVFDSFEDEDAAVASFAKRQ